MTIYTPPQNDKDKAKLLLDDPSVHDGSVTSLNAKDDVEDSPGPRVVEITYFRRNGRSFYVHLLFALAVLVILACGALGAVVFYRHLHKKVYSGKCGTVYFDTTYHDGFKGPAAEQMMGENKVPSDQRMGYVEEDIVVEDFYEDLHTPAFGRFRDTIVRHDFMLNFTAIVDHDLKQCFIMKLNRTAIAPPKTIIELLRVAVTSHAYFRRANVIRQDFEVAYTIEDLTPLGAHISDSCAPYPTLWLEKKVSGVYKRSVETVQEEEEEMTYALMSNFLENPVIYKVSIHNIKKMEKVVVGDKVSTAA